MTQNWKLHSIQSLRGGADLLNHRLLKGDMITIDREENFLIRKFLLIDFLRNPISDKTFDEKVEITQTENHPVVLRWRRLVKMFPEYRGMIEKIIPSRETYISNMKKAIELRNTEELMDAAVGIDKDISMAVLAQLAITPVIAFWDCEGSGQEFVLPKIGGTTLMDGVDGSNLWGEIRMPYKMQVVDRVLKDMQSGKYPAYMSLWSMELQRMLQGIISFSDNFSIYPFSPTRALVYFSPYFRGFFPMMDSTGRRILCPPIFSKEQFDRHFYKPMRMELFKPCANVNNQRYTYQVRHLSADEVLEINAVVLEMETQEFAFHDYNKIRDSFRFYDDIAQFVLRKKHDFSRWG